MDPWFGEMPGTPNTFKLDDDNFFSGNEQSSIHMDRIKYDSLDLNVVDIPFRTLNPSSDNISPLSNMSNEAESLDDQDSDSVLMFLNQILGEENLEEKSSTSPISDNFGPLFNVNYEAESPGGQDSDPVFKFLNQILIEESLEEKPSMSPGSDNLGPLSNVSYGVESSDDQNSDPLFKFLNEMLVDENLEEKPSMSPSSDNLGPLSDVSYEVESPDDQNSDPVFKFLNQILVEENFEEKPSMFHDPLALRAAEKSFYEVLGQEYPPSPYQPVNYDDQTSDTPDSFFGGASSDCTNGSKSGTSSVEPGWTIDPGEYNSSVEQSHLQGSSFLPVSSNSSSASVSSFSNNFNYQMSPFENTSLLQNIFSDSESILQFKRGMEEASKFLPPSKQLVIELDKFSLPKNPNDTDRDTMLKIEKNRDDLVPNGLTGKKHHYPDDSGIEDMERSSKQSAVDVEEVDLSEMFDRLLLCNVGKGKPFCFSDDAQGPNGDKKSSLQPVVPNCGIVQARKNENQSKAVDLRTLLISCAQSVASDDRRTAYKQLKQIRQHSSPEGDAYQRLANVFANGLEARLGGTGNELYSSLIRGQVTAVEKLKAYRSYLSACPFETVATIFAINTILMVASKATTLHVVDFGILYGFQWPSLIQRLSWRPNGPPKLRITGIELPQPGFRPAERIEETGSRLAKYCKRFGVPFEYQAIATQNWEAIKIEDIKIRSGEVLAVNTLFRFGRLQDESVVTDSPRDAVLNLIRKMNPDIVTDTVSNGSYNAPFFVTRFREALFHYSALFDMFDATLPRDDPERMHFEQDFYGREVINIVACEGAERVERPETYKQWQVRYGRAGFKPVPLNPELMKKLRHKVKSGYHRYFLVDEDGNWMLQGWKGRIICASSCWVPA